MLRVAHTLYPTGIDWDLRPDSWEGRGNISGVHFKKDFMPEFFQTLAWKPQRENANILDKKDPFIGV